MTHTSNTIGALGEELAARFMKSKRCRLKTRNFRRRWGELDLVCEHQDELVFVEVKSVRCRIPEEIPQEGSNQYRPEENVSHQKRQRLRRIVQTYLDTQKPPPESWRFDVVCVYLDQVRKTSRVKWLRDVII